MYKLTRGGFARCPSEESLERPTNDNGWRNSLRNWPAKNRKIKSGGRAYPGEPSGDCDSRDNDESIVNCGFHGTHVVYGMCSFEKWRNTLRQRYGIVSSYTKLYRYQRNVRLTCVVDYTGLLHRSLKGDLYCKSLKSEISRVCSNWTRGMQDTVVERKSASYSVRWPYVSKNQCRSISCCSSIKSYSASETTQQSRCVCSVFIEKEATITETSLSRLRLRPWLTSDNRKRLQQTAMKRFEWSHLFDSIYKLWSQLMIKWI